MKTILIIGIGAGNPEHITIQAVNALNRVDVFFIMDKGEAKGSMIDLRRDICARFITANRKYRFATAQSPQWDRHSGEYNAVIGGLNSDKQAVFEQMIAGEMQDGETAGVLVWGDPSLYDSTIRIMTDIAAAGRQAITYDVIPGISSLHALTAQHRTTLNTVGQPVEITTGRRLTEGGFPPRTDSVFVMLDGDETYRHFAEDDSLDIYWGAYVGTPDEILIAGRLKDVAGQIAQARAAAKKTHGWIMDSYLLRRRRQKD
ncbi:precorrin-6A synthase (deacetylating) [Ferrovibrio terrae]|uniref:Precorrin-6A synthase [deacetylating] n=1 Tax=Ferrovibrio terrae TaxID=2594003 RepID=A0A516H6V1_9PROT|nr:precorrin-6A synthase (deacetylating) [Ferrovibrio terrae]QDO99499.1 precorrin-6A synthase (deacetylating) [Ferrovibrio terrae]